MILRDLVSRITFKTDTTQLKALDSTFGGLKRSIGAIAGTAFSAFAVKTGGSLQLLQSQFDSLEKKGVSPLRDEMKRLTELSVGGESIFSERDVTRAGIGLRQLGFNSQQSAEFMKLAANTVKRTGGDFLGAAQQIGQGIAEGGALSFLRSLGLLNVETEKRLAFFEQKISAGDPFQIFTRRYRASVLDVIRRANPELEEEAFKFMTDPESGASVLRVSSQFENLWTETATTITNVMGKALDKVAEVINGITGGIKSWEPEIRKLGDTIESLLSFKLGSVGGGTLGALLALVLTRGSLRAALVGFGVGAAGGEAIGKSIESDGFFGLKDPNSPLFRFLYGNPNDPNSPGGLLGLPPGSVPAGPSKLPESVPPGAGQINTLPSFEGMFSPTGFNVNWSGDLIVNGAANPEETARVIKERFVAENRRAVLRFIVGLEG